MKTEIKAEKKLEEAKAKIEELKAKDAEKDRAIARPHLQKRRLYHTDQARASAISEIKRLIEVLGHIKSGDLSYADYRGLIKFLADHKDAIEREMNEEESQ